MLLALQAAVLADPELREAGKGKLLEKLAEADKNLVDGSDEFLQLLDVTAHAQLVLTNRV